MKNVDAGWIVGRKVCIAGPRPHIFHAFGRWHHLPCMAPEVPWVNEAARTHANRLNDLQIYGVSPVPHVRRSDPFNHAR